MKGMFSDPQWADLKIAGVGPGSYFTSLDGLSWFYTQVSVNPNTQSLTGVMIGMCDWFPLTPAFVRERAWRVAYMGELL